MSAAGSFHLAWRYVAHHRARTALLALALGLTLALPLAVRGIVEIARHEFRARSEATPLVLGAKGSSLELTLNALYFRRRGVEPVTVKHMNAARATGLAKTIPLYARFHSQDAPIIGTSLDYFSFRELHLAEGKMLTRLGDCVVGARVARARNFHAGGSLVSSPEQVFDITGVYPLKMRITGVLEESHTADDDAVFVDVKTAWLIEGIAHGHDDVVKAGDQSTVLDKSAENVAVTNAVKMFSEVTDENIGSFHFHGDPDTFPLTAAILLPNDAKSQAILLGRYQSSPEGVQLVVPTEQMDALMASLFQAERIALLVLIVLGVTVLFIAALVFALSFKLRRREFATLQDIGVARSTVAAVKAFEVLLVGGAALFIVFALQALMDVGGLELVRLSLR